MQHLFWLFKNKYTQLLMAYTIFSLSGVMAKMAALNIHSIYFFLFAGFQVFILAVYAIAWQQIIKKFSLVTASAYRGAVLILSLIWATVFFGENITLFNLIGSAVIVVGIYIVSSGESEAEGSKV